MSSSNRVARALPYPIIVMVVAAVASCSSRSASPVLTKLASSIVLADPPQVCDVDEYGTSYRWDIGGLDAQQQPIEHVRFSSMLDPDDETVLEITGEERALCACSWVGGGGTLYFVVGTYDASERFALWRYTDTNADGVPDASSRTLLLDSGATARYVTYVRRIPESNDVYLLDARTQDILVGQDTDQSGWPDAIAATPFAMSDTFEALLEAGMLYVPELGTVDVPVLLVDMVSSSQAKKVRLRDDGGCHRYRDTNQDGVADQVTTVVRPAALAPHTDVDPYDGQSVVRVYGDAGKVAQVWLLDGVSFEPTSLLGAGSLGTDGTVNIAVSPLLHLGDAVGCAYATALDARRVRIVVAAKPQISEIDPVSVPYDASTIVTITGVNFVEGMEVVLLTQGDAVERMLSATVNSAESAVVTLSNLGLADVGGAVLRVSDGAQPEPSSSVRRVSVFDPDAE